MRNLMPPYYTSAIGELILPRDEVKSIIKDMKKGTLLIGSNGSVIDNIAIYGYMILTHNKKMDTRP